MRPLRSGVPSASILEKSSRGFQFHLKSFTGVTEPFSQRNTPSRVIPVRVSVFWSTKRMYQKRLMRRHLLLCAARSAAVPSPPGTLKQPGLTTAGRPVFPAQNLSRIMVRSTPDSIQT